MKKSNNKNVIRRFAKKGVFPYQFAFTLLIPIRNIFLSPKMLIKRLELKDNYKVMELGPGPGYFSLKVATVLAHGKLVLADIQPKMLDYAKKRINKKGLTNVEYYLCDGETFYFDDNTFDIIYMVTVIGEVEKKDEYFAEFHRILKPAGILSMSEQAGDPDKMSINEIKFLAEKHHLTFHKLYGKEENYTINFIK